MKNQYIFNFKTEISQIKISAELNNPFATTVPEIAKIAAQEFQDFIKIVSPSWEYDFHLVKGKMFGVLVVEKEDRSYGYLGTVSGKLPKKANCAQFIPSVFDDSTGDFFINKGMTEITAIRNQIKKTQTLSEITTLKEKSKEKSIALQQRLFENYHFTSRSGKTKKLIDIFKQSNHAYPPSAAGECAAPKLLDYALEHQLKPIALAEFWWGKAIKKKGMHHKAFYPACKNRCLPILEYMLEDFELYNRREQFEEGSTDH